MSPCETPAAPAAVAEMLLPPAPPASPVKKLNAHDARAMSTLSYKLDTQEKKKHESKSYRPFRGASIDATQLEEYLTNHTEKHLTKSTWKTLDMSFKWKYISDYIDTNPQVKTQFKKKLTTHLKNLLQKSKLSATVIYDNKNRRIESLGIRYNYDKGDVNNTIEL